jgi:hypothetical protein
MPGDGWLKLDFSSSKLDFLREQLTKKASQIHQALFVRVSAIMAQLQTKIITTKLSGQVLNKRTGLLQSSVRLLPTTSDGSIITGSVAVTGPRRDVAMIHTMGMDRAYEVMAVKRKALAWAGADGKMAFARRVMHPPIPAKPFMWPALKESKDEIVAELGRTVADVLKQK